MILNLRDSFSLLDPVTQGQTLTEKAVDVHIVDGKEMIARWYHSPNECDLMIWFHANGGLSRFQLNAGGQITDWCESEGLQTGLIVEIEFSLPLENRLPNRRKSVEPECAETIQFDSELNDAALHGARELIGNASALASDTRRAMVDILAGSWPHDRKSRPNSSRTRFWGRFKRWTGGT